MAIAQSSSKQSPSGSTQMQNAPASQSGSMSKESPSSKEQAAPDKATNGQNATSGQNEMKKSTESSPSSSQKGMSSPQKSESMQPSKKSTQSTSQPSDKSTKNGADRNNRSTTAAAPSGGQANLTTQQKTVIKNKIIENKSAPRVSHVDFNVSVGVAVPTTVHLAPVPVEIVHIHPAWKSYEYFVYEEEVIIVNPHTHKIVEIITVS